MRTMTNPEVLKYTIGKTDVITLLSQCFAYSNHSHGAVIGGDVEGIEAGFAED
jgi:hypothetical protein